MEEKLNQSSPKSLETCYGWTNAYHCAKFNRAQPNDEQGMWCKIFTQL